MATSAPVQLDRIFAALGDPTRRGILERLAVADRLAVSELAAPFAMSLPAVLKHVSVLTEAGLVAREKIGRTVYCRLDATALREASLWLAGMPARPSGRPSVAIAEKRDSRAQTQPKTKQGRRATASKRAAAAARKPSKKPAKSARPGRAKAPATVSRTGTRAAKPRAKRRTSS